MNMEQIAQLRALVSEETPDVQAFAKLSRRVRTETEGLPETERKARFLETLASELPTPVFAGERLLGSMRFWSNVHLQPSAFFNMGHIVVDYGSVLEIGLQKLAEKLDARNTEDSLFSARAVRALSKLILRYANAANETAQEAAAICRRIAHHAPETFHEALQLLWFIHLFLHAEGMSAAISFGRFDMYMYPYYRKDMEAGKLNREAAMDLLACLWLKTCEGDESQNLTLGGEGENELSCLCLEVSRWLQTKQPSLSARIGKHTSGEFMAEVIRLIKSGLGMPAIFNDPVVESALTQLGIPAEEAHDYAIVGCYEANPPQALGLTVAGAMQLHRGLLDWLPVAKHDDFDTFLQDYKDYFVRRYLETELPGFVKVWETVQARMVSPFESACISACVNSGLAAEHKGAKYTMFGINILGLGTLTDSLYAVKKLVFEGGMDYDTFVGQVLQNFPDLSLSEKCKSLPGKYGTDNPETNALAQTLSAHIARTVMQNRFDADIICYPGLFQFTGDIYSADYPATPDGRLNGERISYGVAASDFCTGKTATSILNSAAHASNDLCACGNPVMLHLTPGEVAGERGDMILESLIRGFFEKGGFHVQFNVSNTDTLMSAREKPQEYQDLMIRISGFSTQFVGLNDTLQEALIERSRI